MLDKVQSVADEVVIPLLDEISVLPPLETAVVIVLLVIVCYLIFGNNSD